MKSFLATVLVGFSILGLGATANASTLHHSLKQFAYHGTDAFGFAIVTHKGITYHLTEGDTLDGITYLYNETSDIVVKINNHLTIIPFSQ